MGQPRSVHTRMTGSPAVFLAVVLAIGVLFLFPRVSWACNPGDTTGTITCPSGGPGCCPSGYDGCSDGCCCGGSSDGGDGCSSPCGGCFNCNVCQTYGGMYILTDQALAALPRESTAAQGNGIVEGVMASCSVAYAKALSDTEQWSGATGISSDSAVDFDAGIYMAVIGGPFFLSIVLFLTLPISRRPIRVILSSPRRRGQR